MGNTSIKETVQAVNIQPSATDVAAPAKKPNCKACCACPDTKRVRDQW